MEKKELLDKISNVLNKYKWNYKDININILLKDDKTVYYNISIKYDDDKIETKKYKKHLIPYNRKVKINPNSLNNLKYMKKLKNDNTINVEQNMSNIKDDDKNDDINLLIEDPVVDIKENESNNKNNFNFKEDISNIESKNIENKYSDKNYKNDGEFIDVDVLFNKEIDETKCDNCEVMDNNIIYLSNKIISIYLDVIKKYDNIIDNTYNINVNLEDLINVQNVKDKELKMNIYNIIQNKKKLNVEDINSINSILSESDYDMPHISTLFRNKIVDPIMEELRFFKNEYNNFLEII